MSQTQPKLFTATDVAVELGVPFYTVLYCLRTRPKIEPAMLCGQIRMFDQAGVEQIRVALEEIADRRRARARTVVAET